MRKTEFWKTDWFLGMAVSSAALAAQGGLVALRGSQGQPGQIVSLALLVAGGFYLVVLAPGISDKSGWLLVLAALTLLLGARFAWGWQPSFGLHVFVPGAALLGVGQTLLTLKRNLCRKSGRSSALASAPDARSSLGQALALQAQGRLNEALQAFVSCPVDDALADNVFRLGLELERQGLRDAAITAFRFVARVRSDHREARNHLDRLSPRGAGAVNDEHRKAGSMAGPRVRIGPYMIERTIGRGSMGMVYLGREPDSGAAVAIKTMALSDEFDADVLDDVKARFFREAEAAGRLHHPAIVAVYEAGEDNGLAYIAMEYCAGTDLRPFTKKGALLTIPQVVEIVARLADALAYAHRNGIVHRDVKPANVIYAPESGQVKIMDFGVARITDVSRTRAGTVLGTPSYMSPEQLRGLPVDGRSDLFSLGVMLYVMTSGKLPFVADSMAKLMFKIVSEPPPDIRGLNPQIGDGLVAVIERALQKDAAHRYQTGEELARALRACDVPGSLPAVATGEREGAWTRR